MWNKSRGLLVVVAALASSLFGAPTSWGEQTAWKVPSFPEFFRVYSEDGRESLTGNCAPTADDLLNATDQDKVTTIRCKIVLVGFRRDANAFQYGSEVTFDEAAKLNSAILRDVKDAAGLKEKRDNWTKDQQIIGRNFCTLPGQDGKTEINRMAERYARDSAVGPKRKRWVEELRAACSEKDYIAVRRKQGELEKRTCELSVDYIEIEFRRVGEGQWLFQQERPDSSSNTVRMYELTRDRNGFSWTVAQTRVPTKGSEEILSRSVWNTEGLKAYELSCDFVSYEQVHAR